MEKVGLVLEGGGMRGVYTGGVLDFFMSKNLYFPYIVGVSAGACNAASYLSRQQGRNKVVTIDYVNDPRYINYKNLLRGKSFFGMDFMFGELPNKLHPLDYAALAASEESYWVGATDCRSGKAVYYEKTQCSDILTVVRASSSLPFITPIIEFEGKKLLDGGISDPIPLKKSLADGNSKNVVILTRNWDYRKKPFSPKWLAKSLYLRYPKLAEAIISRHKVYNATLDYIAELEKAGKVFVIRPQKEIQVQRIERDESKLKAFYEEGFVEADSLYEPLLAWLNS